MPHTHHPLLNNCNVKGSIMSQTSFLVLYRCTMDDLPVRLFTGPGAWDQALAFALELSPEPPEDVQNLLGLDASSPHSVAIITFIGGVPTGFDMVRDFNDLDYENMPLPASEVVTEADRQLLRDLEQ